MQTAPWIAAALALVAAEARANDSIAETAAGGLVLTRTTAVDMVSEDLFVSAAEIRVRYVFRNRTSADVAATVAFPMPERRRQEDWEGDVAFPTDFRTTVDGKTVQAVVERKETATGAQETWHWQQTFPAGRDLVVEHRYTPGTGGSVSTALTDRDFRASPEGKAMIAAYCIDPAFLAGVDRMAKEVGGADYPVIEEQYVSYILTTGANWASPIGDFRMVVDKGAPENLVSFCADGVRKIGPSQFEVRRANWRPDRDLKVLILQPHQPGD